MSEPGSDHGTFSPSNEVGIDPAWADIDALAYTVREGLPPIGFVPMPYHTALDALTERAKQATETEAGTAEVLKDALAEVERLTALVDLAKEVYEAESQEWTRFADPSDPDEALPPWQGRWVKFADALAGKETTA